MVQPVTGYEYFTLDVFTKDRFAGNSLAVVNDADGLDDEQMQKIAQEFNLAETVFVLPPENSENNARLRIFTPTRELPFAGHPTLGAAVLLAQFSSIKGELLLEQQVGVVPVTVEVDAQGLAYAEFTAARLPVEIENVPSNSLIADVLGIDENNIGFGLHKSCVFDAGNAPLFVPVKSRQVLAGVKPGQDKWERLGRAGEFGVYIYCRGTNGFAQFHARLFSLEGSIVEDPVTGSAAVAFAGVLNEALMLEDGEHDWIISQGEDMGRPGKIYLKCKVEQSKIVTVKIGGHALRMSRGVITV